MSMRRQSRWTVSLLTLLLPSVVFGASVNALSPQDVVRLFMEVYGTKRMAEILPYTLLAFRDGQAPSVWLHRSYRALRALGYVQLDGVIQEATSKGGEVTVVVSARIATKHAIVRQTEIYRLVLTSHGWKLLDLEILSGPPGSSSNEVPSGYL